MINEDVDVLMVNANSATGLNAVSTIRKPGSR
jgi:hypothetical protein